MTASSSAATLDRLAREKERHMPMNWSSRGRRRARYLLTVQLVVTLAVLLAAGQASGVPLERGSVAAPKAKPLDKVERRVLDQIAAKGAAIFFVVLRDRADLAPATKLRKHADRTAAVYQRLRANADRSQARLRQLLRASKVDYKPFWIANTVRVTAGPKLLEKIAALPEVQRVVAEVRVQLPKPSPSLVPCDNVFHGNHTMGTMVGDDGDPGTNQIGVAPHARWIAAKGCEDFGCSDFALLSSGQWVIAPTDLNGQNPRPDLAPNIVNNSWGDG